MNINLNKSISNYSKSFTGKQIEKKVSKTTSIPPQQNEKNCDAPAVLSFLIPGTG